MKNLVLIVSLALSLQLLTTACSRDLNIESEIEAASNWIVDPWQDFNFYFNNSYLAFHSSQGNTYQYTVNVPFAASENVFRISSNENQNPRWSYSMPPSYNPSTSWYTLKFPLQTIGHSDVSISIRGNTTRIKRQFTFTISENGHWHEFTVVQAGNPAMP